jgi:hypothetical protein
VFRDDDDDDDGELLLEDRLRNTEATGDARGRDRVIVGIPLENIRRMLSIQSIDQRSLTNIQATKEQADDVKIRKDPSKGCSKNQ